MIGFIIGLAIGAGAGFAIAAFAVIVEEAQRDDKGR